MAVLQLFSNGTFTTLETFSGMAVNGSSPFASSIVALLTGQQYRLQLDSNFANTAENYLVGVQAVPLPAAAWLFLSVLAGAGFMRRKGVAKA
jgi:hypothetical protein